MVNVVHDTFTGTVGVAVTARTGEVGATWVLGTGFAPVIPLIDSTGARVRAGASGGKLVFASGVATADGEYTEATVDWVTVARAVGIVARAGNIGGAARGYMAELSGTQVTIYRFDSSASAVVIAAGVAHVPSLGPQTYRVTVTGTGASVVVNVHYNGALIHTATDTSGSRLTSPGSCGLYFDTTFSDSTGGHVSEIWHEDPNAGGGGGLTLVQPADGRIFQRSGATGAISVSGTYTGTPVSIEARLVLDGGSTSVSGYDWSVKVASPASGVFAFTFTGVPEGVWYNVQIRDSAVPATVSTSGKTGVGALVAVMGQSNAYLWFARGDSTLTPDAKLRVIGSGADNGIASVNAAKTWAVPATATMNGAIAFGNRLATTLSTLVAVIDVTWDGSGLTVTGNGGKWTPTATAGQPYDKAKTFLNTITSALESAVIVNGETDGANGVSQATFYAAMGTLISAIRADFGASIPIITPLLGKRTDGAITDANAQIIKLAQVQKAADTGVYRVERADVAMHADNVHHTAPGYTVLGNRCAQALLFALGAVGQYRGPAMSAVTKVSASVFDVALTHYSGSDFTPASAITGFRVTDPGAGGAAIAVSAAVRQAASTIRLTLASPPAALPSVQYLWGTGPTVTGVALDNSALTLPLEFNDGVTATDGPVIPPPLATNFPITRRRARPRVFAQ